MTLIQTVAPEQASGDIAALYLGIQEGFGSAPNGLRMLSASPHQLRRMMGDSQYGDSQYYMQHPRLNGRLLAAIRMLVAVAAPLRVLRGHERGHADPGGPEPRAGSGHPARPGVGALRRA